MIDGRAVKLGSRSRRPLQTVPPMATAVGLMPVTERTKGAEAALVANVLGRTGAVLICWQHRNIPTIGNLILGERRHDAAKVARRSP